MAIADRQRSAEEWRSSRRRPVRPAARRARVVVGVSFDRASAVALGRASDLARRLGLELWVVHVEEPLSMPAASVVLVRDLSSRPARVHLAKLAVLQWALFETGIELSPTRVRVCFGTPAEQLCEAVRRLRAELVIVGGRLEAGAPPPGAITQAIVARSCCPVFVAAPARDGRPMVVAPDLGSPTAPVVCFAAALARRLRLGLTVVHNVDAAAPRSSALGEVRELMRDLESIDDAAVTHESTAADGILRVARSQDVDVVVVGVRPCLGLTSKKVLMEARRSVLAVPLLP